METIELLVTAHVSDAQKEIVLDHLIYGSEIHIQQSEYVWMRNIVQAGLSKGDKYEFVSIKSANLNMDDLLWECLCIVNRKNDNEAEKN